MSGIATAMGGGGGTLTINASNATGSNGGLIGCGNPGSTSTPAASVLGGSGNYSYKWRRDGAAATYGPWVCSDDNVLNPTWHAPDAVCTGAGDSSETWELTVTDNDAGRIGRKSISVILFWVDQR